MPSAVVKWSRLSLRIGAKLLPTRVISPPAGASLEGEKPMKENGTSGKSAESV
ncbi:hypothetical protein D3C87_837640 [compost metagenome]